MKITIQSPDLDIDGVSFDITFEVYHHANNRHRVSADFVSLEVHLDDHPVEQYVIRDERKASNCIGVHAFAKALNRVVDMYLSGDQ